jgi:hypothetical protein
MGKPFRTLVRSLGLEDLRLHDLRHAGPSVLLMQGIPGDVVRKITGAEGAGDDGPETLSPNGKLAGWTGLAPATSDVTGERSERIHQRFPEIRQRVRATWPDTDRH